MNDEKTKKSTGKHKLSRLISGIWKNKKRRVVFLICILAVGAGSAYWLLKGNTSKQTASIKEVTVTKGDLTVTQDGDGSSEFDTRTLTFAIGGSTTYPIKEIRVKAGDNVKKGDVIATVETDDLEKAVSDAQLNYSLAKVKYNNVLVGNQNSLATAEQNVADLQTQYQMMEKQPDLFTAKEIQTQKSDLDAAQRSLENLKNNNSDVTQAEISENQALSSLQEARRNLDNAVIKAPFDGTMLSVSAEVGQEVDNDEIAVIAAAGKVYVTSDVLEYDIGAVKVGQAVEVAFDAITGKTYTGKVLGINMVPVSGTSGSTAYAVKCQLAAPDSKILPGMACTVTFILNQAKDVTLVANDAVKEARGRKIVRMYDANKKIVTKQITTGLTDGKNTEVLSGLQAGDKVLIITNVSTGATSSGTTNSNAQALGVSGEDGPPGGGVFFPGGGSSGNRQSSGSSSGGTAGGSSSTRSSGGTAR